ncbi:hypothetical protein FOCC_FOCC002761 [Frankliniella occidentalis]|nr:hypothetical protein FOCC_FOCC002761 [Frankliniella occidentalis]
MYRSQLYAQPAQGYDLRTQGAGVRPATATRGSALWVIQNAHAYEYSQLSQCERDAGDLADIADELGISINTSTDEEELEASPTEDFDRRSTRPATIRVTASYITTLANLTSSGKDDEELLQ